MKTARIILNPLRIIRVFICKVRSMYYSSYIDEGNGKIIIKDPLIEFKISKHKGARLIINGIVTINSNLGGSTPIVMTLGINASLQIDGDFIIGNGVRLVISDNAFLFFGGKDIESGSGITSDTIIMCNKKITIGKDFLCAWGVFISDSDWHSILGQKHQSDVLIGNHVWIANNSSVLKGSIIGDNSIVASHSKVINKSYLPNSLLAGVPAKMVKSNINWSRDI
jgi:acetyltransferase-like isoleucine patch superfamily enzyme